MSTSKVIIIGAGLSGYSAACRFLEKGFNDFTILEASERLGGRIYSTSFGDGTIDIGAQWCHGEKDNIVHDRVKNLNLLKKTEIQYTPFKCIDTKGNDIPSSDTDGVFEFLDRLAEDETAMTAFSGSFGDYMISRFWDELGDRNITRETAAALLECYHKLHNSKNGSHTWFDVSAKGLWEYVECEGDQMLRWEKGFGTILSVINHSYPNPSKKLPVDEKIQYKKHVTKITTGDTGVVVLCKDGTEYQADHVIVTVSLGILKKYHRTMFVPELPTLKQTAIDSLGFDTVCKVFLQFSEKWWPSDSTGFTFLWNNEEDKRALATEFPHGPISANGISWLESIVGFYPLEGHPRLLFGWLLGPLASHVEKIPNNILADGCSFLLNKFLGARFSPPRPMTVRCTGWGSDPLILGTYSYKTVKAEQQHVSAEDLAAPVADGKLLFAGEATHSQYYSTAHGAIESGIREAERVLDARKTTPTN